MTSRSSKTKFTRPEYSVNFPNYPIEKNQSQLNLTFGPKATGSAMAVTNPAGETSVQIQDGIGRTVMTINPEGTPPPWSMMNSSVTSTSGR